MAKTRKRYTDADRARMLGAAQRKGLSGPKAAEKFGISTLTFYNWRKRAGAPSTSVFQADDSLAGAVRAQVEVKVRELLPSIVRDEVASYVQKALVAKRL